MAAPPQSALADVPSAKFVNTEFYINGSYLCISTEPLPSRVTPGLVDILSAPGLALMRDASAMKLRFVVEPIPPRALP